VFVCTLRIFLTFVCFVLSVPVQVIAWKDSSPKYVERDIKLYSLTHSLFTFITSELPLSRYCRELFILSLRL